MREPSPKKKTVDERKIPRTGMMFPMAGEWPEECKESERLFGLSYARLFPLLHKAVLTRDGAGILMQVFSTNALVLLDDEVTNKGKRFPTNEVWYAVES